VIVDRTTKCRALNATSVKELRLHTVEGAKDRKEIS